ncbi:hypothetical protein BKA65DRAFT_395437 [Rhexocercosporidium sp. MPI-PUGE-AT-0058]|nr:hypothetical protein BKA65DRAFT_395437 [Rhexocercosporidium sp. MPI-PUGE-AT-0058]
MSIISAADAVDLADSPLNRPILEENLRRYLPDARTIIVEAYRRFNSHVADEDACSFRSTALSDVWTTVRSIDTAKRKRQCGQNMRRLESLLRGLEVYLKVIDISPGEEAFMPYLWAPVKLMLEITAGHSDILEALLSAYSDIGLALPHFKRYEESFKTNAHFQIALAAIYKTVLDFNQRLYQFIRRRGMYSIAWHLLFHSLWKDFAARHVHIIDSLQKNKDCIDGEAAALTAATIAEKMRILQQEKEMQLALDQNETKLKIAQLQHSIAWLAVDDGQQEVEFDRISRRRHDDTCKWVVETPEFKSWMDSQVAKPLVWVSGKPGAGKSTLCSYLVQHLRTLPDVHTGYYFCNSQADQDICTDVLKTIALQFLRQNPDIASLVSNEYVYRGANNNISQMRIVLPQILESLSCPVIIIDGLDECPLESQKMILREMQRFCGIQGSICKVLISSRKEVQIQSRLAKRPHIQLDGRMEVHLDIRSYVRHKMRGLHSSDPLLLKRLESGLVEKSNGKMFLWVHVVMDELTHCYSDAELASTLEELPKGLTQAYRPILARISDISVPTTTRSSAMLILEWMSCCFRQFKTHEVLSGLVFRPNCTVLSKRTKLNSAVLDICRPLIEIGAANSVDFIHFSAKEYVLRGDFHDGLPFIQLRKAHFDIAFACVCYLNSSLSLLPGRCPREDQIESVIDGFHGLFHYASQFWYMHLNEYCKGEGNQQVQLPEAMRAQLVKLLLFRKETDLTENAVSHVQPYEAEVSSIGYATLDEIPGIKELILDISHFRSRLKDECAGKSPQELSSISCDDDPTYFSTIRQNYQEIVEGILGGDLPDNFLLSKATELVSFKAYGPSAFVCHYIHCNRAIDGFSTAGQRDSHEAHHERKFRCAIVTCVSFEAGFATRSSLKKHNDKYHSMISSAPETTGSLGILQG